MPPNRHRITARDIEELATEAFDKSKRWITFEDVRDKFGVTKRRAQRKLKNCCNLVIFAPGKYKPQRYYPTKLKAKVMEHLLTKANVPIDPTGVTLSTPFNTSKSPLINCIEPVIIQSLEGYVLPLLRSIPPHIHNMHFKTKINPECYTEKPIQGLLDIPGNKGKQMFEIIGKAEAVYTFYPSGTVNLEVKCSNHPFKLRTEVDHAQILIFFGQLRDRLVTFLNDPHERFVPDTMEWNLTECDINRDIKVDDWLKYTGIKIQVRHFDRLFRIYIKSLDKDTVGRVEQEKNPNTPAIEAINSIFNPCERVERQLALQNKILEQILDKLGQQNCF